MRHIPALDGVRAIAILLVMLFHLAIPGFSLGWAGVPLFFVLSGFLITGVLLDAKGTQFGEYIRVFYIKRSFRIFPLFYAYLGLNAVALVMKGLPTDGYPWYLLYLQNYHIAFSLNDNAPGMVGHTWSLAVEEQFYLLWPFVVFALNRRALAWVCGACIVVAPLARWAILDRTGNIFMANLSLPSCIDMLASGALLAVLGSSKIKSRIVFGMLITGAVLICYAIATLGLDAFWNAKGWTRPAFYLYTAMAFAFTWLVWVASSPAVTWLSRLLSIRPLTFTGKISYGLYIWHPICFSVCHKLVQRFSPPLPGVTEPVLALAMAYVVAIGSYYLFELYFLRLKDRVVAKKPALELAG